MTATGPVGPPHQPPQHQPPQHQPPQQQPAERQPTAAGASYDKHIAPFAAPFARAAVSAFVEMTSTQRPVHLLDHGTGTGQVARLLNERMPGCTVHCLDPSADLLRSAPQAPWEPWGSAQLGTAADLHDHDRFDGCVSNLVLPFTADTIEDLRHIRATLAAGAPLVAVTLGTAPEVEPFHQFWDAYSSLGHSFWAPERYVHFRFGHPPTLRAVFHAAGFHNVQLSTVEATRILSPEAVWEWLSSALPVGTGDGYATPEPALADTARHRFLKCSEGRTSWVTRCLIACATA